MRPSRSKPPASGKSRWRRWLVEPILWIAAFVAVIVAGSTAAEMLLPLRFGPEMAAVVAYTGWMIVMIFYPGRSNPGYNPFGPVVRRVALPLLWTHLLALAVLVPGLAVVLYVRARYAPRWLFGVCLAGGFALSLWQTLRSSTLLEMSRDAVVVGAPN